MLTISNFICSNVEWCYKFPVDVIPASTPNFPRQGRGTLPSLGVNHREIRLYRQTIWHNEGHHASNHTSYLGTSCARTQLIKTPKRLESLIL